MMSLAPQLFTGNASNCAKQEADKEFTLNRFCITKRLLFKWLQNFFSYSFYIFIHVYFSMFVMLGHEHGGEENMINIQLFCYCFVEKLCIGTDLVWLNQKSPSILFIPCVYFLSDSRELVPFMSDDSCCSDIKTVFLYIIFTGTEVTDKLLIEYVPNC